MCFLTFWGFITPTPPPHTHTHTHTHTPTLKPFNCRIFSKTELRSGDIKSSRLHVFSQSENYSYSSDHQFSLRLSIHQTLRWFVFCFESFCCTLRRFHMLFYEPNNDSLHVWSHLDEHTSCSGLTRFIDRNQNKWFYF